MTTLQNNNRNTVISCVIIAHLALFIFMLSYPLNEFLGALWNRSSSLSTLLFCYALSLICLGGAVINIALRFIFPGYKYKLRYNLFAWLNVFVGVAGLVLCALNQEKAYQPTMLVNIFLGCMLMMDIYLLKSKKWFSNS